MKKFIFLIFIAILTSCNGRSRNENRDIITVSIAPFKFFIDEIGGGDFSVNVMVPAGTDPHIYEPVPGQVSSLSRSSAYVANGYLSFEITWLDRFYETNEKMVKATIGEKIDVIEDGGHDHGDHSEAADPHYWIAPKSAKVVAASLKELLCSLRPENCQRYGKNLQTLLDTIDYYDRTADSLFSGFREKPFMIFHPALGYIARDYGLVQLAVENEGKEPTPSYMKELIDIARKENIRIIFIQKGFDTKNAMSIAGEIGAELKEIDPLTENWCESVSDIIDLIHQSLVLSSK